MKKLAIIGLGLMGGSLGLAAKKAGLVKEVRAFARREKTRRIAVKRRVADAVFETPQEAVKGADIVVFCLPVLVIPELVRACLPHFKAGCVVTDVGSTKGDLVVAMDKLFKRSKAVFVGSHPIAGSEETGLDAAKVDLYKGAAVVVTASRKTVLDRKAVAVLKRFWQGVGARTFVMSPGEHDRIIARTSHLPHLVASMLIASVYRDGGGASRFCGTGFRDATRIAGGSEEIWHDIVKSNKVAVNRELSEFLRIICKVKAMVQNDDFDGIKKFLSLNRKRRCEFEQQFLRERSGM